MNRSGKIMKKQKEKNYSSIHAESEIHGLSLCSIDPGAPFDSTVSGFTLAWFMNPANCNVVTQVVDGTNASHYCESDM